MTDEFLRKFPRYTPTEQDMDVIRAITAFSVRVNKEEKSVECNADFSRIVPSDGLYSVETGIRDAYGISDCRIYPVFKGCTFDASYVPELVHTLLLYHGDGYVHGFLEEYDTSFDGFTLTVTLRDGLSSRLIENKIDKFFEDAVLARFGTHIKVVFKGNVKLDFISDAEIKLRKEAQDNYIKELKNAPRNDMATPEGCDNRAFSPVDGEVLTKNDDGTVFCAGRLRFNIAEKELLYGNESSAKIIAIRQIEPDKRCAFLCRLFQIEDKENREGTKITYKMWVTDLDSSMTLRLVVDKEAGFAAPKPGAALLVCGSPAIDKFDGEVLVRVNTLYKVKEILSKDDADETRVELHLHTTLSANDALCDPADVIKTADRWGMPAIAVTDHGNVQAFPEIMREADKHPNVKPIYGMEGYLVDDTARAVFEFKSENDISFSDGVFTVFDIETTGLSPLTCAITEIGAVKYCAGEVTDTFDTFVNPGMPIPEKIVQLTGITDEMVKDAPSPAEAVKMFLDFAGDTMLVAHNANFDVGFIRKVCTDNKIPFANAYLDTVAVSQHINPDSKNHKLDTLRDYYKLGEFNHHRACDDCKMLAEIFNCMIKKMEPDGVGTVNAMVNEMASKSDPRKLRPHHISILARTQAGVKNLYKLISFSYLNYYYKSPLIPKTVLQTYREGLILGSACESGEVYQMVLNDRSYSDQLKTASFYDYFEIMPHSNNSFLIDEGTVKGTADLERINKRILEIADRLHKPCVATGDVHFMTPDDEIYRQILKHSQKYKDAMRPTRMYLKTTKEMLDEFAYLGDRAYEVVVTNTRLIASLIENGIRPIPDGKYTPEIEGAEEELITCCKEKACRMYGDPLPEIVEKRMNRELDAIIKHGFAVLYIIARKLVQNSESKGYLVGSRGSVGSSVIAMLADISEVNPLPPHYRCPKCRHSEFFTDGTYGSGFDMDDKDCPECGTPMICDGHDIPFETFLGFKGDKAPDIDLNFSGDVQSDAHKYTEVLFGKENIFRAGTVGTIASKTAYGYVRKFLEEQGMMLSKAEINRLTEGCVGIKRTTGQHPGGIIVVPKQYDVYDFSPVQHPADKESSDVVTTHFAFVYLHDTILKLDMLGHDVPTMYKVLQEYTGIDVLSVPMNDKNVMTLFTSPKALGIEPDDLYNCETGTLGLPEMGTPYVRGMMMDAKPKRFSDLLQISGLSHGTGIWLGNGDELIKSGICTIDTIIGTRDSIMLYLLSKHLEPSSAFKIMESVRKGKGVSDDYEKEMLAHDVPEWYIASCRKIKYMFPKAHAAAYVIAALRLAWFKVYHPVEFYATYFTARPDGIDYDLALLSKKKMMETLKKMDEETDTTAKDDNIFNCLQIINEMTARGVYFLPVDVFKSKAKAFVPENGKIRLPFIALPGLGEAAAINLEEAVKSGVSNLEELKTKSGISKSVLELLKSRNCVGDLPETNQITFF